MHNYFNILYPNRKRLLSYLKSFLLKLSLLIRFLAIYDYLTFILLIKKIQVLIRLIKKDS